MNSIILAADNGRQGSGTVCVANESRFNAAHYSEPLTTYTVGWKDPEDLQSLLDFIAPAVYVNRRFEFKRADNAEAFLSETDDVRSIGSSFKRVSYSGESVNEKTLNKGLTIRVDHDEAVGDDWRERYVQLLIQRLLRNEVRAAFSALDAESSEESVNWVWDAANNASVNPDGDLRSGLSLCGDESGVRPNRILLGESAWDLRASAYEQQESAGAFRSASLTPEQLAQKLFVEGIHIIHGRYQQGTEKARLLGDAAYFYYAADGQMKDEPSNVKRFVTPVENGNFRVYVEESSKYTDITVEHYSNIVVTSSLGLRKLKVSS
jgi:hypothetical protein